MGLDKRVYGVSNNYLTTYSRLSMKYVATSEHGPLSLYTKLRDPLTLSTIGSPYPTVRPLDEFHGHGSCSVCKAALC